MKLKSILFASALAICASLNAQDKTVVGIPVNYDESKVGDWQKTLPDPLTALDGTKITTAEQWYNKRRPELIRLFEENEYGKWPAKRMKTRYEVTKDLGFDGQAVRKQITIYFGEGRDDLKADILVYLPKDAKGPVPILLNLSFSPNNLTVFDPGVKNGRRWSKDTRKAEEVPTPENARGFFNKTVLEYVADGFGFATMCYTDFGPDFFCDANLGIQSLYRKPGQIGREIDEWGAVAAWAFGISHVMDYFETDPDIDAKRVALTGCSRLGKTTIWAGAREPRIAMVIPSCSGEGGAAISRRDYGETVKILAHPVRYHYQFCPKYQTYGDRVDELPVDANLLVALIAPRPLLLSTGTTDTFSDHMGEFYAAVSAGPVYELLGKEGLGTTERPAPETPIYNTLGYVVHEGGHGVMPQDWTYYREFMKKYL